MEKILDTSSRFVTIVHGDFGLHNMLFRVDEEATKLRVIDYGMMSRYVVIIGDQSLH